MDVKCIIIYMKTLNQINSTMKKCNIYIRGTIYIYTYYIIQRPVCSTYIILTYKVLSNKQNYILLCL